MFNVLKRYLYKYFFLKNIASHGTPIYINYKSKPNSRTTIGNNFHSNGLLIIGNGTVYIGDNFHCGFGCNIITENHCYKNAKTIPYDDTYDIRTTNIGDNVWFGINVIILPGVSIGEGAIIQAGSVVSSDIPALAIAGGNPAVVFNYRDESHYFLCKNSELFH